MNGGRLKNPYLSIIIPAYNEATRLPVSLEKIDTFLRTQPYTAEIIVVENGSTDNTLELCRGMQSRIGNLIVIHEDRRGKGWAVNCGMQRAKGEYRFISDADLSMPIEELPRFFPPLLKDAPVAIASREAAGAKRFDEPPYRHFIGRVFNWMVRLLLLPGLQDTQCGFKCFRADVAEKVFPLVSITGWTFDVEALFIARSLGYAIIEIPIPWYYYSHSNIRVFRDSLQMGSDLLKIRWNALRGRYHAQK
jgi:glycosyltransferase involved in cell wall biosynthesis